jgi:hypothetical protein
MAHGIKRAKPVPFCGNLNLGFDKEQEKQGRR